MMHLYSTILVAVKETLTILKKDKKKEKWIGGI
jgi:hypothetical protein